MKTFRKIVTIVFVLFIITHSSAQVDDISNEQKENIKESLEQYLEKLNLSKEQKASFNEITIKYAQQLKDLKKNELSRKDKLEEIKRINADKEVELEQILSSEQYKIHQEYKQNQRKKMLESFIEYDKLNLSEDQEEIFYEITNRYLLQLKDLKNSSKSRMEKFKALKTIKKEKDNEVKGLLSKEQYDVYKKLQNEMKQKMIKKINDRKTNNKK